MKKFTLLFSIILWSVSAAFAQRTGVVQGVITDKGTQETLIGVSVIVEGSNPVVSTTTDADGKYQLKIPVGSSNIKASYLGYKTMTKFNVVVTSGNANIINYEMDVEAAAIGEVLVKENRSIKVTTVESPNSIQRLSAEEIKTSPGGNFDIFKVVQTLPGIGNPPTIGNRNDIIVRGGSPGENAYYLDGIEIPVINHFATQGASGGSNGILNVSFIEDLTLSSSAFDAKYDNALSSVFQFKQRDGNSERFQGNFRVSGSEAAATLEGPLGKNTTFLASARRSYLQYFFKAIKLAIRPDYYDFQAKITHKFNAKTTLTFIGLGAIDKFYTDTTGASSVNNAFILAQAPYIEQWNYTNGLSLKHLIKDGYVNVALSRNMADNSFNRYEGGAREDETKRTLGSQSREIENKLRFDWNKYINGWKLSAGASAQYVKYSNDFFAILRKGVKNPQGQTIQPELKVTFNTATDFLKYGVFAQVSRRFMEDKLGVNFGIRSDMNSFTDTGNNPFKTLSPRASATYELTKKWKINASIGQYAKLPSYTILGYKDAAGTFVNKNASYVQSTHYVAGLEFIPRESTRFTLEGFYKVYNNYPVSVRNGISIANQGADFGTIGNEAILSNGKGSAVGAEFFFQQKLYKNHFIVFSATYAVSKFSGKDGKLIASAWDNRYLLSTTIGRKFRKGWEMGLKYRIAGGVPYTPFDLKTSQLNYATFGEGVLDYTKINTQRLKPFSQFDFRMDKKINFKRTTLDLYFDVTNALLTKNQNLPTYIFERDEKTFGIKTTDGKALLPDGSNGIPKVVEDKSLFVLPSLGFIFEF
jgi:TonB dependent receptor/CarboxypepD_reg-like domain/TonB-dependent Receptor Plug Domain